MVVIGFELRVSGLLNRYPTTCAMPPALFALVYFSDSILLVLGAGLRPQSSYSASSIAGITSVYHHTKLEIGCSNFFPQAGLEPQSFLNSWDYRCEHHA
jgi:hypothetical protein